MNQDHAIGAAVGGGPPATVLLAQVIAHFQGVGADTAGAEAALILLAIGGIGGIIQAALTARKSRAAPIPEPKP